MTLIPFLLIWELICWAPRGHLDQGPSSLWTVHIQALQNVSYCPPKHPSPLSFAVFLLCVSVLWTQLLVCLVQPQHVEGSLFQVPLCIVSNLGYRDGGSHSGQVTLCLDSHPEVRAASRMSKWQVLARRFDQLKGRKSLWGCQPKKILNAFWLFHDGLVFLASLNLTYPDASLVSILVLLFMAVYKAGEL